MALTWTKKWTSSDDGVTLNGTHLATIQDDVDAGFEQALTDAFNVALPSQVGNSGKLLTTDGSNMSWAWPVLDEDDMASDSAVSLATQQSIRAYTSNRLMSCKTGSFTRALNASSGSVSYTGVGFTPKAILFFGASASSNFLSFGITSGSAQNDAVRIHEVDFEDPDTSNCITLLTSLDSGQTGVLSSFDSDGFTIAWTRVLTSASGTVTVAYLAIG
jgi:hypothetical protein